MNDEEENILMGFCPFHSLAYLANKEKCPKCVEDDVRRICGCTDGGILSGSENPCHKCGHANSNHNFGKGCRVSYSVKYKRFNLEDTEIDYTEFIRVFKK